MPDVYKVSMVRMIERSDKLANVRVMLMRINNFSDYEHPYCANLTYI